MGGAAANDWEWNPGSWDYSNPGTYFGIGFGALAGGLGFQAALGPGGWIAGGQGLTLNVGANIGNWATAAGQFAIESGAFTWQGAGLATLGGGGIWFGAYYLMGNEPEGPYIDMTMVNQVRGDASFGGNDPYQYYGSQDRAYTIDEFIKANKGLTRNEIINQLDNRSKTFMNSQQGGPSMRYVINPHDGKVLDMRHMLIIGKNPPVVGNLVEIGQWITGQASGMNPQDFYSNSVGYQFYLRTSSLQRLIAPRAFSDQLHNFFFSPRVIMIW